MNNKILHITPHLGGGVGRVLLKWLTYDKSNFHAVVTLDYANENAREICEKGGIELFSQIPPESVTEKIQEADITLIHFWNHPLLYDFIIRNPLPESRIVIWSHISGANPPYVFNKNLLEFSDKFVFTTPISYNYLNNDPKLTCILSTGGIEDFSSIKNLPHKDYNVCYIGTVDYAKMHPKYAETLANTNADRIFIAGGDKEKEIFKNCNQRFVIMGKIPDVKPILAKSDVFAYMLNPNHYGTGEQVLQEAMAAGVVPVVMNNPCEISLVQHKKTGLVANNIDEYISYINLLKNDIKLRQTLSNNAKDFAKRTFSLEKLSSDWEKTFSEIMRAEKSKKMWKSKRQIKTSYDVFLESLGEYSGLFENQTKEKIAGILKLPEWSSTTKGTPKQYYRFLSGKELEELCSLY